MQYHLLDKAEGACLRHLFFSALINDGAIPGFRRHAGRIFNEPAGAGQHARHQDCLLRRPARSDIRPGWRFPLQVGTNEHASGVHVVHEPEHFPVLSAETARVRFGNGAEHPGIHPVLISQ